MKDIQFGRIWFKVFLRWMLFKFADGIDSRAFLKNALVFSPHQDDETLGCGGTIIEKIRSGARVDIVFMTDGRRSHDRLISQDELRTIRREEACKAARHMGVADRALHFLDFKSGELNTQRDVATDSVLDILQDSEPEEIFIPYLRDGHHEHSLTHNIVIRALFRAQKDVVINEYPVWYWNQWPWVCPEKACHHKRLWRIKQELISLGFLFRDFRHSTLIRDNLHLKKKALNAYRSQVTRMLPDARWKTLGDLSKGEFLECFFQWRMEWGLSIIGP